MERLEQQFNFFREIDKEKLIQRQNYLTMAREKKMMQSMPGICQLWQCFSASMPMKKLMY